MDIQFIASVAVVTSDPVESRKLFVDTLGLPLKRHESSDYFFSESIGGCNHFGLWPLREAAQACFGTPTWPSDRPIPRACFEFEVSDAASVTSAAEELTARGYSLLHQARLEPWGQTVARIQMLDGTIIGISYAPWMHEAAQQR
jgi:catechol 2,3-dioxygenase-like lactoylglutathione lyase family enzyme